MTQAAEKNMKVESRENENNTNRRLNKMGNVSLWTFIRKWGKTTSLGDILQCFASCAIFLHVAEEQNADIMLVLWAGLMWWFSKVSRETSFSMLGKKIGANLICV